MQSDGERYSQRERQTGPQGSTQRERERGISWWEGGISWWEAGSAGRLLCRHTGAFSQMTEREKKAEGMRKKSPEMQRGSGCRHCLL